MIVRYCEVWMFQLRLSVSSCSFIIIITQQVYHFGVFIFLSHKVKIHTQSCELSFRNGSFKNSLLLWCFSSIMSWEVEIQHTCISCADCSLLYSCYYVHIAFRNSFLCRVLTHIQVHVHSTCTIHSGFWRIRRISVTPDTTIVQMQLKCV